MQNAPLQGARRKEDLNYMEKSEMVKTLTEMVSPQRYLTNICMFFLTRSPWLLLAPLLSPTVPQVTSPPCCLCPEGVHRFQWIRNLVPEFGVSSSHVRVLSSPAEFFELMKVRCLRDRGQEWRVQDLAGPDTLFRHWCLWLLL